MTDQIVMDFRDWRSVLRLISEYLNDQNIPILDRNNLWSVLTALRGPDDEDKSLKDATTAVIRKLGLRLSDDAAIDLGVSLNFDYEEGAKVRCENPWAREDNHFISHAYRAFTALDLSWHKVNSDKKDS